MKLIEKMRQKKLGNKGFSLVELIIVIAIMAVLLGIVGTQVVPYLNRAREAKDLQVINSYCTAAVAAYSMHAEDFAALEAEGTAVIVNMTDTYSDDASDAGKHAQYIWYNTITELVGNYTISADTANPGTLNKAMVSKAGKTINDITITLNWATGEVTALAKTGSTDSKITASSVFTTTVTSVISSASN